jgi:hypothetical protein
MRTAEALADAVNAALPGLMAMSDAQAGVPRAPGAWSPKEILGHLIDSAANNHQRFVRAQQGPLTLPGYEQDHWVRSQHYDSASWSDLVTLWRAFNVHLAHVITHVPDSALATECRIGQGEPVPLGFLIDDYVVHLKHHLAQIGVHLVRT